jgi:starch synthase (maltosyl-transferring)
MRNAGRSRVIVESASPAVDGGRYPAKRIVGETVHCAVDLVSDGHDAIAGALLHRRAGASEWTSVPLAPLGNDRWTASFVPTSTGRWEFTFEAWIDHFATWAKGLAKKAAAQQDVKLELLEGAKMVADATARTRTLVENEALRSAAALLGNPDADVHARVAQGTSPDLARVMAANPDRSDAARLESSDGSQTVLSITVDPKLARFGSWYEFFPRSTFGRAGLEPLKHRTFRECEERLPYVANMGFDILYLPPIHPIGKSYRKGPNNTLNAGPHDVGSPWAIGSAEGGHKAIHPELGTLDDFRRFVARALARDRSGDGYRLSSLARPSLRERAPGVVQASARRHDSICGKSAEELSGRLSVRFRMRRMGVALERAHVRRHALARTGRARLPRR